MFGPSSKILYFKSRRNGKFWLRCRILSTVKSTLLIMSFLTVKEYRLIKLYLSHFTWQVARVRPTIADSWKIHHAIDYWIYITATIQPRSRSPRPLFLSTTQRGYQRTASRLGPRHSRGRYEKVKLHSGFCLRGGSLWLAETLETLCWCIRVLLWRLLLLIIFFQSDYFPGRSCIW